MHVAGRSVYVCMQNAFGQFEQFGSYQVNLRANFETAQLGGTSSQNSRIMLAQPQGTMGVRNEVLIIQIWFLLYATRMLLLVPLGCGT